MSLNDSLKDDERAKLAVWDYPVSDKYTKIWAQIQEADPPKTWDEGVKKVKDSQKPNEGFAFIGNYLITNSLKFKSKTKLFTIEMIS